MSDVIQAVGPHKDQHGERCEVRHIDAGVAFGFDSEGDPAWWNCTDGRWGGARGNYRLHIVGPWIDAPTFKPGDLVLVNCVPSPFHQHYGEVSSVSDEKCGVKFATEPFPRGFMKSELKPVTLPAPLPAGYRLKPRNVRPVRGDKVDCASEWIDTKPWMHGKTAEQCDSEFPAHAPYFFAEPIPVPEPPTVDVGEGWRLLEVGETLAAGDEFLDEGTWKPREWHVGYRIAEGTLPTRRFVPKPFAISDHGPGIYLTRDGRESHVLLRRSDKGGCEEWYGWAGEKHNTTTWADSGLWAATESVSDLVRYLRPLPKPEPEWTPTNDYQQVNIVNGFEWTTRWQGTPPTTRRVEQKWTRGTESEWRPVEVTDGK